MFDYIPTRNLWSGYPIEERLGCYTKYFFDSNPSSTLWRGVTYDSRPDTFETYTEMNTCVSLFLFYHPISNLRPARIALKNNPPPGILKAALCERSWAETMIWTWCSTSFITIEVESAGGRSLACFSFLISLFLRPRYRIAEMDTTDDNRSLFRSQYGSEVRHFCGRQVPHNFASAFRKSDLQQKIHIPGAEYLQVAHRLFYVWNFYFRLIYVGRRLLNRVR